LLSIDVKKGFTAVLKQYTWYNESREICTTQFAPPLTPSCISADRFNSSSS